MIPARVRTVTMPFIGVLVVLVSTSPGRAQTRSSAAIQPPPPVVEDETFPFQLGLRGLVGVPRGDFADNVNTSGGIAGVFDYRLGRSPIRVGASFGVLFQGRATREVPFSLTIPDVLVDVTTSANMAMMHGRVRAQPATGRVRPYAEALVGFSYLFTRTTVDLENDFDLVEGPRTTNLSDVTLSAGAGGGVLVGLVEWTDSRLSLDLGLQYLYGGEARYFVGGEQGFERGVQGLELRRSRTDIVIVVAGLVVEF